MQLAQRTVLHKEHYQCREAFMRHMEEGAADMWGMLKDNNVQWEYIQISVWFRDFRLPMPEDTEMWQHN